jgi:hypothetical protein
VTKKKEVQAETVVAEEQTKAEPAGLNLADWLETRVLETVTPSGLAIKMRRVGMLDLLTQGGIPEPLLAILSSGADSISVDAEQLPEVMKAFDAMALACLIEPEIIEGRSRDGKLGVQDMPYEDKEFIFGLANEEATALEPFRS